MKQTKVGKIKSIKLNEETQELEFTISVTNQKFKKKLLRDLSLSGNLAVENGELIFIPPEDQDA